MKEDPISTFSGMQVVEDINMVDYYQESVIRTWKERLFSFSWFTKFKTIQKSKPKTSIFKFENKLIMHPETAIALRNEIDKKKETE